MESLAEKAAKWWRRGQAEKVAEALSKVAPGSVEAEALKAWRIKMAPPWRRSVFGREAAFAARSEEAGLGRWMFWALWESALQEDAGIFCEWMPASKALAGGAARRALGECARLSLRFWDEKERFERGAEPGWVGSLFAHEGSRCEAAAKAALGAGYPGHWQMPMRAWNESEDAFLRWRACAGPSPALMTELAAALPFAALKGGSALRDPRGLLEAALACGADPSRARGLALSACGGPESGFAGGFGGAEAELMERLSEAAEPAGRSG